MPKYHAESHIVKSPEDIKQEWLGLQERANCSYFQSWGWIGIWLEQIATGLQPIVIKVWSGKDLIGIGLFVSKDIKRHQIIFSKAMFLNEYPFSGKNMVIEYNGLLAEKGLEEVVYIKAIEHLSNSYSQVDEFCFGAITKEHSLRTLKKHTIDNLNFIVNEQSISRQVDLEEVPPALDDFLTTLGKNSREQIRRSLRLYAESTPVILIEATCVEEALSFFDELKKFHTSRWISKGEKGSFANPIWEHFHRTLIQERFKAGEIQMLKISNSDDIAFLFNYIWRGKVYVLQMGFHYTENKRFKPGYVAHAMAIVHNKAKGMAIYDFMHGESRYKKSLSNKSTNLYWVALQRQRLKFSVEKIAVSVVRRFRKITGNKSI